MSNPFLDVEEEGGISVNLPPEFISVFGNRESVQLLGFTSTVVQNSTRDALMLEVFLTTTLPRDTLGLLISLLNHRWLEVEAAMNEPRPTRQHKTRKSKQETKPEEPTNED